MTNTKKVKYTYETIITKKKLNTKNKGKHKIKYIFKNSETSFVKKFIKQNY